MLGKDKIAIVSSQLFLAFKRKGKIIFLIIYIFRRGLTEEVLIEDVD